MLGKLVKNELKSYRFSVGITFLAGLVFTIFMKIICMLPYRYDVKEVVQVLGFYGYYYLIMMISVAVQVLIVIRFYSTMVGDRGYLTFTLPVKTSTHIWAKLIGGGIWGIIANIVTILLFGLFLAGDYWSGIQDIVEEFDGLFYEIGMVFEPKYIITIILALLTAFIWSFVPLMMIYMCIAIGQLFGKWRILASIGCYFVIVIILYVLMIIGMVAFSIVGANIDYTFFGRMSGYSFANGLFGVLFLVGIGVFALFFAITNFIFKRHLNLE